MGGSSFRAAHPCRRMEQGSMLDVECSGSFHDSPILQGPHDFPCIKRSSVPCLQVNSMFLEPQSGKKRSAADINLSVVCTGHV